MKKIAIEGMMCGHCVATIEKKLKSINGIGEVQVSLDEKFACISGEVEDDVLKTAIEEEGYKVVSIETVEGGKKGKEKKGFFSKLLKKIGDSNVDSFGEGRMECCDLSKKERKEEEKSH